MNPPLHIACRDGNLEIVKFLVNAGADTNRGDGNNSRTPLHYACMKGDQKLVEYLIKKAGCKVGEL